MQVVELSSERVKLPAAKEWIDPRYEGVVSEFDAEVLGVKVNKPSDWSSDFPTYDYKFSTLTKLVETFKKQNREAAKAHAAQTDVFAKIIEMGGEYVGPDWVDTYEQFQRLGIGKVLAPVKNAGTPRKQTLTKYMRITESKPYRSFHDGKISVVMALKHFMRKHRPNVTWQWLAVIDGPDMKLESMRKNTTLGIDGDKDFSNINNIRGLEWEFSEHFGSDTINLYTGDSTKAGWKLPSQIYTAIRYLARGGTAMFKIDSPDTGYMVSLIYLLCGAFKRVEFTQGTAIWIVCSEFWGLSKAQRSRLVSLLPFMRVAEWPGPAIFPRRNISAAFTLAIINAMSNLKKSNVDSQFVKLQL